MQNLIAIASGDPSGIGPEITIRAVKLLPQKERKRIIIFGDYKVLRKYGWSSELAALVPVSIPNFRLLKNHNPLSGALSFKILKLAVKFALKGIVKGIVTAPISKKSWKMAGINYNGHTEYFSALFKKELLMAFHKDRFNAVLITEHIPIKELPKYINAARIIKKISLFEKVLKKIFRQNGSKILVAGLNPHCGENGEIGWEEEKIIKPALRNLRKRKILVYGPFNSDTILNIALKNKIFNIVFMYHDQLLTAIKNFRPEIPLIHATWNLPFIRTSPAHGTAFDIAGENSADCSSMKEAIKISLRWSKNFMPY